MLLPRGDNFFLQVLDRFARRLDLAPGICIRRAGDVSEDPACGLVRVQILGSVLYLWSRPTVSRRRSLIAEMKLRQAPAQTIH